MKNRRETSIIFILGVIFHLSQGLRNDLKAALDKIDQQYLNELVGGQEPGEEDTQNDLKVHEENTTIEELEVISALTLPHSCHTFHSLEQMVEFYYIIQFRAHFCLWSLHFELFLISILDALCTSNPLLFTAQE